MPEPETPEPETPEPETPEPETPEPETPEPGGRLSVVIPCYNEAATIGEIVARVLANGHTGELVIVDDGSTDGTRGELARIDDPRVQVLQQPRNMGKGAAVRRGFAAVGGDFVVVQDADLEYSPEDWDLLLEPLLRGEADVVYGSRFASMRPRRALHFWHFLGNRLLTTLSNAFTGLSLTDMETCYKAFRRDVIQSMTLEEDRFGFEPEITAKVAAGGWRVSEVGISYSGRTYAEGKKIGWRDGLWAVVCVLKYGQRFRRDRPTPG